jgi:phage gp36-like protein
MHEMQHLSRLLPDDVIWSAEIARALADVVADLDSHLSNQQRLLLIGIGSIFARQAARETMAALEAAIMIERARKAEG